MIQKNFFNRLLQIKLRRNRVKKKFSVNEKGRDGSQAEMPYEKAYGPGFEDMRRRCPNIEKIRNLIGFEPKYDLEAMIQGVIDYFKE